MTFRMLTNIRNGRNSIAYLMLSGEENRNSTILTSIADTPKGQITNGPVVSYLVSIEVGFRDLLRFG